LELEKEILDDSTDSRTSIQFKTTVNAEDNEKPVSKNIVMKKDLDDYDDEEIREENYFYLDKDSTTNGMGLNYEFGLCAEPNSKLYKILICPYQINKECDLPFLQYLLELGPSAEYNFPNFPFTCPQSSSNSFSFSNLWDRFLGNPTEEEGNEFEDGHTYFMNQCLLRILEMIEIQDEHADEDLLVRIYKGFLEFDKNSIYVFFDFTGLVLKETKANRKWAIIDELVVQKNLLGYRIHTSIPDVFKQNPFLMFITDEKGMNIDLPSVLYLCGLNSVGDYVNLFRSEDTSVFSLFNERVNHPLLGHVYIFSLSPLPSSRGKFSQIRRFAGFTPDARYVLMDIGKKVFLKGEANQPEIFGIKLPGFLTGTKESEVEESEVDESEVDESEVEESEVEESEVDESEVDESEVEEAKKKPLSRKEINAQVSQINNTSIYFKENTLPYWCIKSKLYFTEY
jgi:hypothetical protein